MSNQEGRAKGADTEARPWGPWSTVGFAAVVLLLWVVGQVVTLVVVAGGPTEMRLAAKQGWVLARVTIATAPVLVGSSILLAYLRKRISIAEYLGLVWPQRRQVIQCCVTTLAFILICSLLGWAFERPDVPESMVTVFLTTGYFPVFLVAAVVAAPLGEEFFFRGFLLHGLRNSRLGAVGATVLTSVVFAAIPLQYDLYDMTIVALMGMLLCFIRIRSGSLWLCVVTHGAFNAIATAEAMLHLSSS